MEEPPDGVRPGRVHVPHGEDQGPGAAGHPGEHERGALAALLR